MTKNMIQFQSKLENILKSIVFRFYKRLNFFYIQLGEKTNEFA